MSRVDEMHQTLNLVREWNALNTVRNLYNAAIEKSGDTSGRFATGYKSRDSNSGEPPLPVIEIVISEPMWDVGASAHAGAWKPVNVVKFTVTEKFANAAMDDQITDIETQLKALGFPLDELGKG